eukprot:NODE_219_length_12440_cov_2.445588.p10 type:complete len:171 gc:universal NODE_219_length_12440_cov_2.445588:9881-9369(-)
MCLVNKWKNYFTVNYTYEDIKLDRFRSLKYIITYIFMYLLIFKSIFILMTDIFIGIFLGISAFNSNSFNSLLKTNSNFSFEIYLKMLYAPVYILCIIITLILLSFDMIRAYRIIQSGHIAKSFTSKLAQRYYSIKGYEHYCFFKHILESRSFSDHVAFFVYTHFSNWKRY